MRRHARLALAIWCACFAAAAQAATPAGKWEMVLEDEFNGSVLNRRLWATDYPRAGEAARSNKPNGEAQWYHDNNIDISGGVLHLTAKRQSYTGPLSGDTWQYTSGMVRTQPALHLRYGYIEARVKLPQGSGFWPAFWTWPSDNNNHPEIDVMEFYGDNPTRLYLTYHGDEGSNGHVLPATDWSAGWHVLAANITPQQINWYIDGHKVHSLRTTSINRDMDVILNLAIADGSRAPAPNASTPFPSSLMVDYVRIWKPVAN